MPFERLQGQVFARRVLSASLEAGRPANSYLFFGPPGCGKKTAAIGLAEALLCKEKPLHGCGDCNVCRKVAANKHPDLRILSPSGATFKVEQVRELLKDAAMRPFEGARRVFVLDRVETLNDSAANALLKQLEEPQAAQTFILVTTQRSKVLPTIASRCQAVRFLPLDAPTVERLLKQELSVDTEGARDLAALAGGSIKAAKMLASDDGKLRLVQAEAFLSAAASDKVLDKLDWAASFEGDRKEAELVLPLLGVMLRELWAEASHLEPALRLLSKAPAHGRSLPPARVKSLLDSLMRAQQSLGRNGNVGLVLDNLALA